MTLGSLTWDETGKHFYYTGIDGVALFVDNGSGWYGNAIAWNGVTAVNESPSGAESNKQYADNIEYLNLISKEEFGLTLECFQTPALFAPCDGIVTRSHVKVHGQPRKSFGLIYRVKKGSDTVEAGGQLESGNGNGYVYHIVYGCKAAPSSRDNATVNESPEAQSLSYEITTSPITDATKLGETLTNAGVTEIAHIEIDGSKLTADKEESLVALLYASGTAMPTPDAIVTRLASNG